MAPPEGTGDAWATLASPFVDGAYASVKGQVRTYVLHHQLLDHLPEPPVSVLDVGGGAGHQSFPLARLGHHVTLLDPSAAMLARAEERRAGEDDEVRRRIRLVEADGEAAADVLDGERFAAVLCHGVLLYQPTPEPLLDALCRCVAPGGILSLMTLNAATMAVRAAVEHRWADALAGFDATEEIGPLGVPTRADTVEDLTRLVADRGLDRAAWYGVLLFTDWMDLPVEETDIAAVARVELEAVHRDPYRLLSRSFHLVAGGTA